MSTDKIYDLDLLLPSYLHESVVPEFIKMMINEEGLKKNPTSEECFLLSTIALEYKTIHHILTKGDDKRYKIPDRLSSEEVAVLAMLLFIFKNVCTRENASSDETLLGMYVGNGVNKGLYTTIEKDIRVLIKRLSPNLLTKDIDNIYDSIDLYASVEKHCLIKEECLTPASSEELLYKFEDDNGSVQQFWDKFRYEFAWDLLPSDFLYELYVQWFRDVDFNGTRLGRNNFLEKFAQVTSDELVDCRDKQIVSKELMDGDEPLITDYYVSKYMVSGQTLQERRNFTRKYRYRGFLFPDYD